MKLNFPNREYGHKLFCGSVVTQVLLLKSEEVNTCIKCTPMWTLYDHFFQGRAEMTHTKHVKPSSDSFSTIFSTSETRIIWCTDEAKVELLSLTSGVGQWFCRHPLSANMSHLRWSAGSHPLPEVVGKVHLCLRENFVYDRLWNPTLEVKTA